MNKFPLKPLPGQSAAADALIAASEQPPAVMRTDAPAQTREPATPRAQLKAAPRPFMLRLPPSLDEKIRRAHGSSLCSEFRSRHDMLVQIIERGVDELLARRSR